MTYTSQIWAAFSSMGLLTGNEIDLSDSSCALRDDQNCTADKICWLKKNLASSIDTLYCMTFLLPFTTLYDDKLVNSVEILTAVHKMIHIS